MKKELIKLWKEAGFNYIDFKDNGNITISDHSSGLTDIKYEYDRVIEISEYGIEVFEFHDQFYGSFIMDKKIMKALHFTIEYYFHINNI